MPEGNMEHRFARFAAEGDADAFAAVFDELAPQLFAVATRLTRDRAAAEDLTQATWLAAIQSAGRYDASRPLRPWLMGILVRQAQLARRRERPRSGEAELDDVAAAREVDAVESRDTREFIGRAVARLSPADRAVLAPWLLDERTADELAREFAARPDTVRMRIHRGLERLRGRLSAGLGLGLVIAWLDRRALARSREVVMQSVHASSPLVAPSLGAAFAFSKLALVLTAATVALVAVATVGPWFAGNDPRPLAPFAATPTSVSSASVASQPLASVPSLPSTDRVAAAPVVAASAAAPTRWLVVGRVNAPNEDGPADLVAFPDESPVPPGLAASATSASDGTYSLDVTSIVAQRPGLTQLGVRADHPTSLLRWSVAKLADGVVVTESGETRLEIRCDFELAPAAVVRGRVELADGDASSQYEAQLFTLEPGHVERRGFDRVFHHDIAQYDGRFGAHEPQLVAKQREDRCTVSVRDTFSLRAKAGGKFVLVVSTLRSAPTKRYVDATLGETTDVGVIAVPLGATIRGSVDPREIDVAKWIVGARPQSPFGVWMSGIGVWNGEIHRSAALSSIDERGGFALGGLEASVEYEVALLPKPNPSELEIMSGSGAANLVVRAPAEDVRLGSSSSVLELAFQADAAAPEVADARIELLRDRSSRSTSLRSDAPLSWTLVPGEDYRVTCRAEGWTEFSTTLHAPPAGEFVSQPVRMRRQGTSTLRWKVVDEAGAPIRDVAFGFVDAASTSPMPAATQLAFDAPTIQRALHDDGGEFALLDVPIGTYTVRVHAGVEYHDPRDFRQAAEFGLLDVERDERTIRLLPGGKLRVVVAARDASTPCAASALADASGAPVAIAWRRELADGGTTTATGVCPGTSDVVPNLAPGDYALTVTRPGRTDAAFRAAIVANQVTTLELDLDAP